MSSSDARSPAITAAGSPGLSRISRKTTTATTSMTTTVDASLRTTKLIMAARCAFLAVSPGHFRARSCPEALSESRPASLLLDVPVHRNAGLEHARDVRAERDRLEVLAERNVRHRL